jgi:hypothetical protein
VKLSAIELKDRILGNVPSAYSYVLPPIACKIETLKPNDLSLMLIWMILIHLHYYSAGQSKRVKKGQ